MTKSKAVTTTLFSGIFLLIICAVVFNQHKSKELKKNGIMLTAEILEIVLVTKGSPTYKYKFMYNDQQFLGESSTGVKKLNFFIGKKFPVIFSPGTLNSELLISPQDFKKFGIPFPDSLNWVVEYQNN
ncbi:MAG: hypothetical protein EOO07_20595 [Chitinophagaceae bacterium]|nr:MAG: hypothetical protein EOO07_20595 [Chitinophagaceae bacterium]